MNEIVPETIEKEREPEIHDYHYTPYEIASIVILVVGISVLVWLLGYLLGKRVLQNDEVHYLNEVVPVLDTEEKKTTDLSFEDIQRIKDELDKLKSIYAQRSSKEVMANRSVRETQFLVQVSAYKKEAQAQTLVRALRKKGFNAFIEVKDKGSQSRWYRVRVGMYRSREDALRAAKLLSMKENLKTFITSYHE